MASKSSPASLCVGAREPMGVLVRDVSRNGMGLTTPSPMLVGSQVVVICGGLTINATVRHCRERVIGEYSVGISINRILHAGAGREI